MNRPLHILSIALLLMLSLASIVLLPSEASCRLSGEADLGYADYESSGTDRNYSGNSFTQRYSLLYDAAGTLAGGRLGKYDVGLGFEWLKFNTTEKQGDSPSRRINEDRAHLNYRGDLILNPKELPLKLRLYSQDPNRSVFSSGVIDSEQVSTFGGYTPVTTNITTGIDNGIHVTSGATLVMGVKNGMTNGYNEVLRHFPMLMLDYRDEINRDLNRLYPVNTRLSRLAFVSLNKKDNWFHYRYVTYDDKIDGTNNYKESQFQLGTVDNGLQRRWVDFTNWLNVSVDGQFTQRKYVRFQEDYDEMSINLFAKARRQTWELRTFNNFTRLDEINLDRITYMTTLPAYASGTISPTAGWSAYAKYDSNTMTTGGYFKTITGGYSVDTFRKSPFTLTHGLTAEQVSISSNSDTLILTGNIGTSSTRLFSDNLSLKARYDIRNYHTDSGGNGTNNFLDQEIKTMARYTPINQVRIIAQQDLRHTDGSSPSLASPVIGTAINSSIYQGPGSDGGNTGGSTFESTTNLRVEWTAAPRLNFNLSGTESIYVPEHGERDTASKLSAMADYNGKNLKIFSNSVYATGEINSGDSLSTFTSTNDASVIFSRSLDAKFNLTYVKTFGTNSPRAVFSAAQSLNYRYRAGSGFARDLFEINESFTYAEEVTTGVNTKSRHNTAMLGAKYFPLRQLMIAGGAKYFFENNGENAALNYYGTVAMNFRLLTASIDYAYGKNKADGRVEKRLSANLKKRF